MAWRCRFLTARPSHTAASSPRNDLVKNCRVHPTHWLISTQVAAVASVWLLGAEGFEGFGHVLALSDQPQTLAVLAWTALASTALTILLQTYALARVPAATASLVVSSEPLWAALLAAVLLGETNYGAADVAGGALILGASLAPAFLDDDAFAGNAADDDSE